MISTLFDLFTGVVLAIAGSRAGENPSQVTVDLFATLAMAILCVVIFRLCLRQSLGLQRFRITLLVALLVPLVLCPVFKFGLLVPLPTEGFYIEAMEQVKYLLRAST
ncbi:MAG: hypothetical protein R3F37_02550 [Candidatus Competibacteraceae bacterium]